MSRQAPAVRLQGGADRRWQRATRWLALATVAGTSGWWLLLWQQHSAGLWPRAAVPLLALLGALAARPRRQEWNLHWDGAVWHLDGAECRPRVALDLGGWLLLRLDGPGRRHWLALAETDHPAGWHALRCALYCARPSPPPGHGAAPTSDER